jgi:hypothetical protein
MMRAASALVALLLAAPAMAASVMPTGPTAFGLPSSNCNDTELKLTASIR